MKFQKCALCCAFRENMIQVQIGPATLVALEWPICHIFPSFVRKYIFIRITECAPFLHFTYKSIRLGLPYRILLFTFSLISPYSADIFLHIFSRSHDLMSAPHTFKSEVSPHSQNFPFAAPARMLFL